MSHPKRIKYPLTMECPVCGRRANLINANGKEYFCITCMIEINMHDAEKVKLYKFDKKGNRKPFAG